MVATAAETAPMITPARRATCIAVSTKKREGQEINEFDHRQIRAVQNYRKASPKFPRELLTSGLPFAAPAPGCGKLGRGGDHVQIGLQIPDFTWPGGPGLLGRDLATV